MASGRYAQIGLACGYAGEGAVSPAVSRRLAGVRLPQARITMTVIDGERAELEAVARTSSLRLTVDMFPDCSGLPRHETRTMEQLGVSPSEHQDSPADGLCQLNHYSFLSMALYTVYSFGNTCDVSSAIGEMNHETLLPIANTHVGHRAPPNRQGRW